MERKFSKRSLVILSGFHEVGGCVDHSKCRSEIQPVRQDVVAGQDVRKDVGMEGEDSAKGLDVLEDRAIQQLLDEGGSELGLAIGEALTLPLGQGCDQPLGAAIGVLAKVQGVLAILSLGAVNLHQRASLCSAQAARASADAGDEIGEAVSEGASGALTRAASQPR